MQRIIEQTENRIQKLESQVEQVQNVLQEIGDQIQHIADAIARLENQGDWETSEAIHINLRDKRKAEQVALEEIAQLTVELESVEDRLTEAQTQNDQSREEIEALDKVGEDVGNALDIISQQDAILRFQEQQVRTLKERLGYFVPADTVSYEPRSVPPISERVKWVDEGVQPVAVDHLPSPEGIHSTADFQKISEEDMASGILRLQGMLPTIESGTGANSDYWATHDKKLGLEYTEGLSASL